MSSLYVPNMAPKFGAKISVGNFPTGTLQRGLVSPKVLAIWVQPWRKHLVPKLYAGYFPANHIARTKILAIWSQQKFPPSVTFQQRQAFVLAIYGLYSKDISLQVFSLLSLFVAVSSPVIGVQKMQLDLHCVFMRVYIVFIAF